jgi:hypothetical protein
MKKLPYSEGTWFAVPLRNGGFGAGVVARATRKGRVIFTYLFGPRRDAVPSLNELECLTPDKAVCMIRVGDLGLMDGTWPVIGKSKNWDRASWPMPAFIRRDELSHRAWRVHYSDTDPTLVVSEVPHRYEDTSLEENVMCGAGSAEIQLTKLLS